MYVREASKFLYTGIGSDDHNVYALDVTTGMKMWNYKASNDVAPSPTVSNGIVYVRSGDNNVYAPDAGTGTRVWSYMTGNMLYSSAAATTVSGIKKSIFR